jgi:HD superfamily phosphohydrolase
VSKRIIRDPIHGFISLSHYEFVQDLVDTEHFQRLRRLYQLGVSIYVYPSATHNRLNHSLGAMHLFVRLFDSLYHDYSRSSKITKLRKLGIASVLLHDIGHGPFSHMSEKIFEFNHEKMTNEIIENTEIKDILSDAGIRVNDVTRVIGKTSPPEHRLIAQLTSSQLDVDRLDYLARDTYFTGAEFGRVDINRITEMMAIYKGAGDVKGYAVTVNKGINSVEAYILSRHLMYQGVYFHKTTRCFELIFAKLFERAKALVSKSKLVLPKELEFIAGGALDFRDIRFLDDHVIYSIILQWTKSQDRILKDLADRIVNRRPLKGIEVKPGESKPYWDNMKNIEKVLRSHHFDPTYYLLSDEPSEQPYSPYSPRGADDKTTVMTNIFVLDEHGQPKEISQLSPVVKSLSDEHFNFRLYVPHSCVTETSRILGMRRNG